MRPFDMFDESAPLIIRSSKQPTIAIISNPTKFLNHKDQIEQWLKTHDCRNDGMVIVFPTEEIANWFELRWC